jgi:hypothetical protein
MGDAMTLANGYRQRLDRMIGIADVGFAALPPQERTLPIALVRAANAALPSSRGTR